MRSLNYLDNLVARSLPEAAVVQPRPVSLFEPWPAAETGVIPFSALTAAGEEGMTDDTAVAPAEPVQPAPPLSVQPPHLPTRPPLSPEPVLRQQVALPTADHSAPVKPALSPLPAPIQQLSTEPGPRLPGQQEEPHPAKVVSTREIIREQVTSSTPATSVPAKVIPTLVTVVREQPIQPATATATATAIRPQVTILPAKAQLPAQPNNKPSIYNTQFSILNSQFSIPPEPAPTIQITIGRIEVRATPPAPAKAEKRQPPAPVMSLDDYLRRRNGDWP